MDYRFIVLLLAAILSTDLTSGKPDGAPDACCSKPEHGVEPQSSEHPYEVKKKEKSGAIEITIKKEKFKGILLKALVGSFYQSIKPQYY